MTFNLHKDLSYIQKYLSESKVARTEVFSPRKGTKKEREIRYNAKDQSIDSMARKMLGGICFKALQDHFGKDKIIGFFIAGSTANDTAGPHSDIDCEVVVAPTYQKDFPQLFDQIVAFSEAINQKIQKTLLIQMDDKDLLNVGPIQFTDDGRLESSIFFKDSDFIDGAAGYAMLEEYQKTGHIHHTPPVLQGAGEAENYLKKKYALIQKGAALTLEDKTSTVHLIHQREND